MKIQSLLQNSQYQQKRVLENLICHFQNIKREQLRTSMDQEISLDILNKIKKAYDDFVIDKKPLEYVLGYVEFMNNQFKIDSRALIPRPETEYMIQAVNEYVTTLKNSPPCEGGEGEVFVIQSTDSPLQKGTIGNNILLDIGTGCGVLGLSVILHNENFFQQAYLSEYINDTLSLAQENYEIFKPRLGDTKVNLVKSNLLNFLENSQFSILNSQLILVANLPYIPDEMFDTNVGENVKNREPRPAFVGGDDGLDYYREMFEQIFKLVENGRFKVESGFVMFLEMMTWQVDILRQEFGDKISFEEVKTFHFNIRIVKAQLKIV
ncbi:MAG TPA: hypothetical protein VJ892_00270 [Candidatus Absconditabacterales bacterium]|nr:hypothetical protein [Candidatus Absconditabacterales bacterium]